MRDDVSFHINHISHSEVLRSTKVLNRKKPEKWQRLEAHTIIKETGIEA
jgi:hypothetical protein